MHLSSRPSVRHAMLPAVAALSGLLVVSACGGSPSSATTTKSTKTTHAVKPLTPAFATPQAVVTNYLKALGSHDTASARTYIVSKQRTSIMGAKGSGFSDLVSLTDVRIASTQTGIQKPSIKGVAKDDEFAKVVVDYTATFSGDSAPSGSQSRSVTLGRMTSSKRWLILAVADS